MANSLLALDKQTAASRAKGSDFSEHNQQMINSVREKFEQLKRDHGVRVAEAGNYWKSRFAQATTPATNAIAQAQMSHANNKATFAKFWPSINDKLENVEDPLRNAID